MLARCLREGISLVAVGTRLADSREAVELAGRYSHVWASVGLHPTHAFDEPFDAAAFRKLVGPRVVGVGETGLDYFHAEEQSVNFEELRQRQLELLKEHIRFARAVSRPLILHVRNGPPAGPQTAYRDVLATLRRHRVASGVVHCFGGTVEEALAFVAQGLHLGFTANLTYPHSEALAEAVAAVPLERILTETDAPFLAPQAQRGKRNEPANVRHVAERIAAIKKLTFEEVAEVTAENARQLFGLRS